MQSDLYATIKKKMEYERLDKERENIRKLLEKERELQEMREKAKSDGDDENEDHLEKKDR